MSHFRNQLASQDTSTFAHISFEYSEDEVIYIGLGEATPDGMDWLLTGLNLPTGRNLFVHVQGYFSTGVQNASESITEMIRSTCFARHGPVGF